MNNPNGLNAEKDNRRTYIMIIYALYALSMVTLFSSVIGVIVAFVKREDMRGSGYENHIDYLIKTFWVSLTGCLLGWLTAMFGIGLVIWFIVTIWFIYRVVAGFIKFYDGKPVDPKGWF